MGLKMQGEVSDQKPPLQTQRKNDKNRERDYKYEQIKWKEHNTTANLPCIDSRHAKIDHLTLKQFVREARKAKAILATNPQSNAAAKAIFAEIKEKRDTNLY